MECPKCQKEMEPGYIALIGGNACVLRFCREEPSFLGLRSKSDQILRSGLFYYEKEDWLRKGNRCEHCRLIIIEY